MLDPLDGDNGMGAEAFVCKHGRRSELPERKRRTPSKCLTEEVSRCGTIPGWGWGACLCVTCCPVWTAAGAARGICFASSECWHRSWAFAYCVEDYCCTCCPCDLPRTQPVRGRLLVRIRHFAEVQLRILEGYSLQGVDEAILYGKASSDPYCVVEYRGKKVLKTKYRSKTLRPEVVRTDNLGDRNSVERCGRVGWRSSHARGRSRTPLGASRSSANKSRRERP